MQNEKDYILLQQFRAAAPAPAPTVMMGKVIMMMVLDWFFLPEHWLNTTFSLVQYSSSFQQLRLWEQILESLIVTIGCLPLLHHCRSYFTTSMVCQVSLVGHFHRSVSSLYVWFLSAGAVSSNKVVQKQKYSTTLLLLLYTRSSTYIWYIIIHILEYITNIRILLELEQYSTAYCLCTSIRTKNNQTSNSILSSTYKKQKYDLGFSTSMTYMLISISINSTSITNRV